MLAAHIHSGYLCSGRIFSIVIVWPVKWCTNAAVWLWQSLTSSFSSQGQLSLKQRAICIACAPTEHKGVRTTQSPHVIISLGCHLKQKDQSCL